MKQLWSRLETLWCRQMHPAPMWPAHGYYQCPDCLRRYPVPWKAVEEPESQPARSTVRVLRTAE